MQRNQPDFGGLARTRLSVRNRISGGGERGGDRGGILIPYCLTDNRFTREVTRIQTAPPCATFSHVFHTRSVPTLRHFFFNIRSCDTPLENNAIRSIRFISFVTASPSISHAQHVYNTPFNSGQKANDATQTDGGCE